MDAAIDGIVEGNIEYIDGDSDGDIVGESVVNVGAMEGDIVGLTEGVADGG